MALAHGTTMSGRSTCSHSKHSPIMNLTNRKPSGLTQSILQSHIIAGTFTREFCTKKESVEVVLVQAIIRVRKSPKKNLYSFPFELSRQVAGEERILYNFLIKFPEVNMRANV